VGVFVEITIDEIDSLVLGGVIVPALFRRKFGRDPFTAALELCRDNMRAFLEAESRNPSGPQPAVGALSYSAAELCSPRAALEL
jgi:hypothetical protein